MPPKPKGFPIATTQSPILASSEFPNLTGLNFSSDSICKTAISIPESDPRTFALKSLPPFTLTTISSAPWMTWLFVITIPFSSIINPDPRALVFLCWGAPKSLNISSKGDPGGNWNGNGLDRVVIIVVVEIFTTDGINFSARSAKDEGISFVFAAKEKFIEIINIKKNFKYFFIFLSTK